MRNFLLIILLAVLFSCRADKSIPADILKPQKMQEVFWDYLRADAYANDIIKLDSTKDAVVENLKLQDKLFRLHKTSREEFNRSYAWYRDHKKIMVAMIDSMVAKKEREYRSKPAVKSF